MSLKKLLLVGLCLGLGVAPVRAQEVDAVVKKIKATNSLTMGYRETIFPTGFLDENKKPAGYAVDMCLRIIDDVKKELGTPDLKINYVPVNIQNRQALVANGTVDLECGGTVNTFARAKQVDFSPVTFIASNQLLVLKNSGIHSFADLAGKILVVATGGSSEPELKKLLEETKLNIRVQNVDDHAAALIAVESRRADAYFSDNSAFMGLVKGSKHPENLAIVGEEIGYAPQAFMVPKNNPTFLWIVDHAMAKMFQSGEAATIFNKWFEPYGLTVTPKLRAAWATFSYPE